MGKRAPDSRVVAFRLRDPELRLLNEHLGSLCACGVLRRDWLLGKLAEEYRRELPPGAIRLVSPYLKGGFGDGGEREGA